MNRRDGYLARVRIDLFFVCETEVLHVVALDRRLHLSREWFVVQLKFRTQVAPVLHPRSVHHADRLGVVAIVERTAREVKLAQFFNR